MITANNTTIQVGSQTGVRTITVGAVQLGSNMRLSRRKTWEMSPPTQRRLIIGNRRKTSGGIDASGFKLWIRRKAA